MDPVTIEADRENLKDNVFQIKHQAEWLYDAGDSMIALEHVRALIDNPPEHIPGRPTAFCDFAGPGDESVLALCDGNQASIVDCWRSRDTMHSVGKFLAHFRRLGLNGYDIGGDEGYGHQLMDRMAEEGFYLQRFNNGSPAKRSDIYANLAAEWCSRHGEAVLIHLREHAWEPLLGLLPFLLRNLKPATRSGLDVRGAAQSMLCSRVSTEAVLTYHQEVDP